MINTPALQEQLRLSGSLIQDARFDEPDSDVIVGTCMGVLVPRLIGWKTATSHPSHWAKFTVFHPLPGWPALLQSAVAPCALHKHLFEQYRSSGPARPSALCNNLTVPQVLLVSDFLRGPKRPADGARVTVHGGPTGARCESASSAIYITMTSSPSTTHSAPLSRSNN